MVSLWTVVGWILIYTLVAQFASYRGWTKESLNISGPLLTVRSDKGLNLIERLSKAKQLWGPWGWIGIILSVIGAIAGTVLVALTVVTIIQQPESVAIDGPQGVLVIPGVNPFLPLSAAPEIILGLAIALVVHEGGHAIMCRVGDIDIDSTGLIFFAFLPLGAFVEPDEESQKEAPAFPRVRMFAAGIMNNVVLTIICVALLFVVFAPLIGPAAGIGVGQVYSSSPAEIAGIEKGDNIVEVNGQQVESLSGLQEVDETSSTTVTLADGETLSLETGAYITGVPQPLNVETESTITSVNGESVAGPNSLQGALRSVEAQTATLGLSDGSEAIIPVGVYSTLQEDSTLASASSLSATDSVFILSIDGNRVYTPTEIGDALPDTGETTIQYVSDGETKETTVQVSDGTLGVAAADSTSGVQTVRFGFERFPAEQFISLLQLSSDGSLLQKLVAVLALPIAGTSALGFNFPGFTPFIQSFYTIPLLPSQFEFVWFFASSLLFWTAWININLAIFNCLPTYALDGGHILRAAIYDGLGDTLPDNVAFGLEQGIKASILLIILGMVLGPAFI